MLEGTVWYDHRIHHRYGASQTGEDPMAGSPVRFGEAGIRVRIGDDYFDDRKVNFNIEGYGTFLHDDSKALSLTDARQIDGAERPESGSVSANTSCASGPSSTARGVPAV